VAGTRVTFGIGVLTASQNPSPVRLEMAKKEVLRVVAIARALRAALCVMPEI
jgi:hypothetical protein